MFHVGAHLSIYSTPSFRIHTTAMDAHLRRCAYQRLSERVSNSARALK